MKSILSLIALIVYSFSFSQQWQWVSENYTYDSILNIEYGSAINFNNASIDLNLDLYTPNCNSLNGTAKTPLLIFIHGGSFIAGDKSETTITNLCKNFAKRGYATASVNYRLGFINSNATNNCNFPNYQCFFTADTSEWYRAYYRAVQDVKGALRFLVNRNDQYNIDTSNIFVAGESAGAFIAMGVGFMDVNSEKFIQADAITSVLVPNANTISCPHNVNETFIGTSISRPDLGNIDGNIEPTTIDYAIKGVGNMYGGMLSDLLTLHTANKPKPALYSFHQPCDLVVPFETDRVYAGMNWCFTNGYGCNAITQNALVYGSKTISDWNTQNSLGYGIQNEFTTIDFPYEYIGFQPRNCVDQVLNGNSCHGYDNLVLRRNNLATFFAPLVTSTPICLPSQIGVLEVSEFNSNLIYPNPFNEELSIKNTTNSSIHYQLMDAFGRQLVTGIAPEGTSNVTLPSNLSQGIYTLKLEVNGKQVIKRIQKINTH
jgi:predicted esterase